MSALGDYVHFHKDNYRHWGTNKVGRRSEPTSSKIQSVPLASYFNQSKIQELTAEAQYLENEYNKLFYPSIGETTAKSKTFKQNLEQIVQKKLDEEFGSVAGTFNAESLSVDRNELYAELDNAIRETRNRLGMAKISKNATANNLLRQVELMYNVLNQQEFKGIAQIQSRLEEAKGQLNNIKNNLLMEINAAGGNVRIENIQDIQTLESIIQEFNRIPLLYKQNRAVFEWIVPFIKIQTSTMARQELAKTMESLISNDVKVEIDTDELQGGKDINIDIDEINVKTLSTNNSSQITISYRDSQGVAQRKDVVTKNIKSSTRIQLLNKTSLYQLLTLSNTYNFANHYLNIVTAAPGQTSDESEILEANRLLKSSILNFAIENYDSNNNVSFLVINDYSKKHIFVYSVKLLLYLIDNSLLSGNNKYSNVINLEDDYTIPNNFADTVATRIGRVLTNVRNKKINGFISPGMLNAYKSALLKGSP